MRFSLDGKEIELRGIQGKPSKVISSNSMTKLLKKGHYGVISQLCSLDVQTSISFSPLELQIVINNHSKVFGEIPKGLPPAQDHNHVIHLQPGNVPPNIRPYMHPYAQKSEIEHMIQEMLEASIIQTSQSFFSSPMVIITKKDGSWYMCPNYRQIDKITIKDNFPILVIDELHGSIFFTKLDLHLGYHQIRMRQEDIPKNKF
jgi:hypothetical protein